MVASRRGLSGIERRQGVCHQWKARGQCSRGDKCSFRHDSDERAKSTLKATPSSEPPAQRGGSASRKGTLRGRRPSWKSNRQPCKDFSKGICTKNLCEKWRPPKCQVLCQNRVVNSAERSFPHWEDEEHEEGW